ncbi:extensin [Streptomyces koyangensis]|uniref:extensin n=1 Tax=Streptomyces koyangensis TaxID=188770 RepID=UPI003BF467FC
MTAEPTVQRVPGRTTGALAASAAAAVAASLSRSRPAPAPTGPPPPYEPPPAYSASAPGAPPPYTPGGSGSSSPAGEVPPAYRAVAEGGMDPRELTDFQLDELVHRIIGRVTRLVRTELRMDRERIGRLRDPRG